MQKFSMQRLWAVALLCFALIFGIGCNLAHAQKAEDLKLDDPAPVLDSTPAQKTDQKAEDMKLDDPAPVLDSTPAQKVEDMPLNDPAFSNSVTPVPNSEVTPVAPDSGTTAATISETAEDANSFIWHALFAGLVVAVLCSYLGIYVVARKMVFIGVALAEISSAGIALGVLLGFAPLYGALAFMLLGVFLLSKRYAPRRLPPDAPVGVFYVLATACAILMIAKSAEGEGHMLTLLRGDILAVYPAETFEMLGVFIVIGIIHALFAKEFLLVSLDRDTASTLGFSAEKWDFLLFLTIGVAVALAIRSVGVLMTSSMLILPAATALLLAPRWNRAAIVAPIIGVIAVCAGLWLSLMEDFPTSAVIVAVLFAMFAPVLVWNTFVRKY